ncbi:hypothetical protein GE061_019878 [Apolygus lucorum]|uniref:Uncharacterized protein n=1 Tax=Apolygus lucorum TaxID=248454 RepID=A0A8S9XDP8_APOLU|nr:hypothetical protein GE061_019878 [Apolygus lucorum]
MGDREKKRHRQRENRSSPRDRRSLTTSSSSLTSRSRSGTPEDNLQSPRFDKFSRGCPPTEQHSPQVSATGSQPGDLRAPPDPVQEFLRLREGYPFPPNFMAMSPPEINPELLPVLSQTHKGRDGSLLGFQRQVGTAAVAIGTVLGSIISNPSVTGSDILKPIWDAGKSLMALQYDISRARRRRICDSLDGALKRATKDVPPTSWLFGDDLRGKLREVEGISSFSQGLLQLKRGTPREKPIQQPPQQRQHQRPQVKDQPGNLNSNRPGPDFRGKGANYKANPRPQYQNQRYCSKGQRHNYHRK